ncbi:unnamed protein product [Gongylonema pulchrum]|uniref:Uncharacterized protein n=1 Tax=Gongylonema pulchrum TaxID=637853 RepID=A0A183ECD0_9BILA|nr:unnamed protein product [Gongylonema pulchrum]
MTDGTLATYSEGLNSRRSVVYNSSQPALDVPSATVQISDNEDDNNNDSFTLRSCESVEKAVTEEADEAAEVQQKNLAEAQPQPTSPFRTPPRLSKRKLADVNT